MPPLGVPKVHPATREMLPQDPLELTAFQLPGDPDVMAGQMIEELARMGWTVEQIMRLAQDPFYVALHSLWLRYGPEELCRRISQIVARCGVLRVRVVEAPCPVEPEVVELERPDQ